MKNKTELLLTELRKLDCGRQYHCLVCSKGMHICGDKAWIHEAILEIANLESENQTLRKQNGCES